MKARYFLFLIIIFILTGCGGVGMNTAQEIEEAYENVREKVESGEFSEQQLADEYAKLCEQIAKGTKEQTGEYAALLRKITSGEYEFEDSEVFAVAESCAKVFAKMAEGFEDFGVQDITVRKGTDEKYTINFEYCGETRAYSLGQSDDEDKVKVTFYDAKCSNFFKNKYPFGEEFTIEGLKFKTEYTADHGFVIYIDSDVALSVEEKELTEVNRPEGTIEFVIMSE